ncbi:threonine-phosphate decarboxylase CobD [Acerihabitans arboris]|uniref:threonine-phosphate decarboxylase n=1 Tax=Acerihabitans arboris TaxID=2691583 RepID=A0A845SEJ0_9GAMM|nr:threonine-phosphate decarboxylase CobD [Acerihabitans arboris]NDL63210.1 threonine-phosphate decarboxylase [Acerihabitans arboris]
MALPNQHGGNVLDMALKLGVDETSIVDFSANINPLGMPASLKRALAAHWSLAERYPDPLYRRLHDRLAAHHQCPASWILAGNGATELIYDLAFLLRGKTVLLPTPGFAEYRLALKGMDCRVEDFPLTESDDFSPDHRLPAALRPGIDALFLCTPNNPTGQLIATDLLLAIARRCRELAITLVVDEAFMDFIPDGVSVINRLGDFPNLFVLRSLTKFYAIPGLRLGYMLGSDTQAMARLRERRPPWTINAFAALAGEVVLDDLEYQRDAMRWLQEQQTYLYGGLSALPALKVWRPAANYIFFRCQRRALDLQAALLQKGLLIRSCANYPGLSGDYYRVAIKGGADNRRLLEALGEVLNYG